MQYPGKANQKKQIPGSQGWEEWRMGSDFLKGVVVLGDKMEISWN